MRAVDHGDQMMELMNAARKSKKAWKKLFSYGLEISKFNAFIIENHFKPHAREKKHDRDYFEYTLELCHGLAHGLSFRKRIGRPVSLPLDEIETLRLSDKYH